MDENVKKLTKEEMIANYYRLLRSVMSARFCLENFLPFRGHDESEESNSQVPKINILCIGIRRLYIYTKTLVESDGVIEVAHHHHHHPLSSIPTLSSHSNFNNHFISFLIQIQHSNTHSASRANQLKVPKEHYIDHLVSRFFPTKRCNNKQHGSFTIPNPIRCRCPVCHSSEHSHVNIHHERNRSLDPSCNRYPCSIIRRLRSSNVDRLHRMQRNTIRNLHGGVQKPNTVCPL
ncbi:uncharacterized protein LOC110900565 [Helianthus annuus]|uniref:uncharacterized protein LOC110900565 n=1 Tax=Helianthus annuus TaxID=4232 RepID=UPI000B8F4DA9|nr:uncharacterized protein LOC110900565 [Helianthus annuus]